MLEHPNTEQPIAEWQRSGAAEMRKTSARAAEDRRSQGPEKSRTREAKDWEGRAAIAPGPRKRLNITRQIRRHKIKQSVIQFNDSVIKASMQARTHENDNRSIDAIKQ